MTENYDFEKVKEIWKTNIRPTVLYLHNPFCITEENCKYCVHRGSARKEYSEKDLDYFYFDYMPKMFGLYEPIINEQEFVLVNFGGGTPNILSAELLDNYLSLLPKKFKSLPKVIELHPALLTARQLDILKRYNFTTVIFCVQTFDENTLKEQRRLIPNFETLKSNFEYAKSLGFNVATDLITYWHKDEKNWEILDNDLKILKELSPDEITVSPLYQNKYSSNENEVFEVYRRIRKLIAKYFPDYENPENTLFEKEEVATIRIYKPNSNIRKDFDIYINSLTDVPWQHEQGYSTLGIGSFKNKDKPVFSIIGPDYTIYEEFNDFNTPNFTLAKNWNFWASLKEEISKYEKLGNPPVGTTLAIRNVCGNSVIFYERMKQENAKLELIFPNYQKSDFAKKQEDIYLDKISELNYNLEKEQ